MQVIVSYLEIDSLVICCIELHDGLLRGLRLVVRDETTILKMFKKNILQKPFFEMQKSEIKLD